MKTCVHCDKKFERAIDHKCPFCGEKYVRGRRKCPECDGVFAARYATASDGRIFCPHCNLQLYIPKGKGKLGQALAMADKETSEKLVQMLEATISTQYGGVQFAFDYGSERERELKFAYSLVDRSKTFLRKQDKTYGLDPHGFIVLVMETMLADPWWKANIKSYQMVVNQVSRFALQVFGERKRAYIQNLAQKNVYIDYTVLTPEWN